MSGGANSATRRWIIAVPVPSAQDIPMSAWQSM